MRLEVPHPQHSVRFEGPLDSLQEPRRQDARRRPPVIEQRRRPRKAAAAHHVFVVQAVVGLPEDGVPLARQFTQTMIGGHQAPSS